MNNNSSHIILGIVLVLLFACGDLICYLVTQDTVVATVKDKVTKRDGDDDKYIIFTNKEVLENTDEIWALKCDSSDVYSDIEKGKTYEFTVVGLRIKACSCYRNILESKEIIGISREVPSKAEKPAEYVY